MLPYFYIKEILNGLDLAQKFRRNDFFFRKLNAYSLLSIEKVLFFYF